MTIAEAAYRPAEIARGYTDRILRVNLSENTIEIEALPEDFKEKWIPRFSF